MERGNTLIIAAIFMAIILTILMFAVAIFTSHVNNTLYNVKLDMYSIARSGIISVNKNQANVGNFKYDVKAYKTEFEKSLKENYKLNEDFENEEKLISKIKILEYKIYKKGEKDNFTKNKTSNRTLHIVLEVKLKPIIFRKLLEKIFVFKIHEDVNLNVVNL